MIDRYQKYSRTLRLARFLLEDVRLDGWPPTMDCGEISMRMDRFSIPRRFQGGLQGTVRTQSLESNGHGLLPAFYGFIHSAGVLS